MCYGTCPFFKIRHKYFSIMSFTTRCTCAIVSTTITTASTGAVPTVWDVLRDQQEHQTTEAVQHFSARTRGLVKSHNPCEPPN